MEKKDKKFLNRVTILALGAYFILAIFLPDDILSRFSILRSISETMSSLIPSIENLTRQSRFPEVTQFVFSIVWITIPIWILIFSRVAIITSEVVRKNKKLFTVFFMLIFPILLFGFYYVVGDSGIGTHEGNSSTDRIERAMITSRFYLGIWSGILALGFSIMTTMFFQWIRTIPSAYFRTHQH